MAWQARYHDAARGARVGRGDGRAVAKGAVETEVLCNQERLGQMRSLDRLWAQVQTRWIFHLEDDWVFDGTGGFLQVSLSLSLFRSLSLSLSLSL